MTPSFSGETAFAYLVDQLAFGPRVPGTDSHQACLAYLEKVLQRYADSVSVQRFTFTGYESQPVQMANLHASFLPDAGTRILLCAHWDTRPRADQEHEADRRNMAIPGANDGASGVAVLLTIAEILHRTPPPVGVDIVLFDGEDYGKEGETQMYFLGAKYFSSNFDLRHRPLFGILLDMVADSGAVFAREGYSMKFAPDIVQLIWSQARQLGLSRFVDSAAPEVLDDHYPLNTTGGIRTVNIIDADLVGNRSPDPERRYWHTLRDTPDRCSAQTLEEVGRLLIHLIFGIIPIS